MDYSIALKPSYNIAFLDQYMEMCKTELYVVLSSQGLNIEEPQLERQDKGYLITFKVDGSLAPAALAAVAQLSFFYMLFEKSDDGLLKPVLSGWTPAFPDDLSIRLKYNGKTNETITRMMMNLALALVEGSTGENPRLLDPLCGRGTTLFEGMISGMDVYGVDQDNKAITELGTYVVRYVKEARMKHSYRNGKLIQEGKQRGETMEMTYAVDKEDYKAGNTRELKVVNGSTFDFSGAFKKNSMDLIVTDFPYNIQHSGKGSKKKKGLSWLLDDGLKAWTPYLRKGGTIALSWNTYTDSREEMTELFALHGYEVLMEKGLDTLSHRVSQGITRDIIIARK